VGLTAGAPIPRPIISAIRLVKKSERDNRVTDQLNDPHASVLPFSAAITPRTDLKVFRVAGWPLDSLKEFLIREGRDLSGPYVIMTFPSWDRDRREFVPTPLVDLTDGHFENPDRSGDRTAAS
jgi:hypothetical protein